MYLVSRALYPSRGSNFCRVCSSLFKCQNMNNNKKKLYQSLNGISRDVCVMCDKKTSQNTVYWFFSHYDPFFSATLAHYLLSLFKSFIHFFLNFFVWMQNLWQNWFRLHALLKISQSTVLSETFSSCSDP